MVVPLYAARLADLRPGDFVVVKSGGCNDSGLIHPAALPSLGLGSDERVVDLAPRLRCRECDATGRTVVSIRWATPAQSDPRGLVRTLHPARRQTRAGSGFILDREALAQFLNQFLRARVRKVLQTGWCWQRFRP